MLTNELIKKYQFFLNYNHSSIEEIENLLQSSRRSILSDIQKVNDVLKQLSLPPIQIDHGLIQAPTISMSDLLRHVRLGGKEYIFQEERLDMIVLYLLLCPDYISNYDLQSLLRMSKNSILTDLKDIRILLQREQMSLEYTRSKGYFISGSGNQLRQLLERTIEQLMLFASGKWILDYVLKECSISIQDTQLFSKLRLLAEKYQLTFIFENTKIVSIMLAILNETVVAGQYQVQFSHYREIRETALFQLVQELEQEYPKLAVEREFILARLAGCVQGDLNLNPDPTVVQIMDEIIMQVKANTGLDFPIGIPFRKNLYAHLYPAYYRLLFNISLHNPLTKRIMSEYHSLYDLVKRSLKPLAEITNKELSDDEIAYFTIHFGGYLSTEDKPRDTRKMTALILCPNGISTSLILHSELQQLFPIIEFKTQSLNHFREDEAESLAQVEIVFSTTPIEGKEKVFTVKPLMNSLEKMLLKRRVFEYLHLEQENVVSVEGILAIIHKYTMVKNAEALKKELTHYLFAQESERLLGGDSLTTLLKKEFIQQKESVADWREAIRVAANPLLNSHYIEESYIEAIITSINELGPYIVLAPKVAVPHASPEAGVHRLGISLLQLKESVDFSETGEDDKKVQLIFVLAAVDSTSHLTALQQLAIILEDEDIIDELIEAANPDEILTIIDRVIQEGEEEDD